MPRFTMDVTKALADVAIFLEFSNESVTLGLP